MVRGGNMMELKPCPFCGGKAILYTHYFCICSECQASTRAYGTPEETVEAWNRRAKKLHGMAQKEQDAVQEAIIYFADFPDGYERAKVVDLVLFLGTHIAWSGTSSTLF